MTNPTRTTSTLDRLAPLLPLLAAFAAFFALGLNEYVSLDMLRENRALLKEWVQQHRTEAALIFIAAYIVVAAASLPAGAVLSVTGGFLFGSVFGTAWIVIGATIGATILFLIARSTLGEPLRQRFSGSIKRSRLQQSPHIVDQMGTRLATLPHHRSFGSIEGDHHIQLTGHLLHDKNNPVQLLLLAHIGRTRAG